MAFERGVILGPKYSRYEPSTGVGFTIDPNGDPALIRHAVLYFDRIHWAQNAFMMGGIPAEIVPLCEAGIADARITQLTDDGPRIFEEPWFETLRRGGRYPFPMPPDMEAAYFKAQAETFLALDKTEPDVWTMGGHAPMWEAPESVADRRVVAEIKINAALPTPPNETPIADVYDFRERHKAKFIEFRTAIDGIYASFDSAVHPLRAEAYAIDRLNAAIAEVRAVSKASWLQKVRSAVKIDRTLSAATIVKAVSAYEISNALLPNAPLVAALTPFAFVADKLKVDFKELLAPRGLSDSNKSYSYLLSLASEFDIS